jgi:hypothetical protein
VLGRMANGDYGPIAATTLPGGQAGLAATFPASCGRDVNYSGVVLGYSH